MTRLLYHLFLLQNSPLSIFYFLLVSPKTPLNTLSIYSLQFSFEKAGTVGAQQTVAKQSSIAYILIFYLLKNKNLL